jgi:hypothetical protein
MQRTIFNTKLNSPREMFNTFTNTPKNGLIKTLDIKDNMTEAGSSGTALQRTLRTNNGRGTINGFGISGGGPSCNY